MTRYHIHRWRPVIVVGAVLAAIAALSPQAASAATPASHAGSLYPYRLLAKAQPDECFDGVGNPYPAGPPCAQGQAKVNQGYVWGLTRVHQNVWFGTGANVNCLVAGGTEGQTTPILNSDYVCEFGQSQPAKKNPSLPPGLGDQRPPDVFYYDGRARKLVDKTADVSAAGTADATRLQQTLGLRAAGSFNGVVLMAGQGAALSTNIFAFNGDTGQYLGSATLTGYSNIRHFLVADGALYAGVGVGQDGRGGGRILRWTGTAADPFEFVVVGTLPTEAADLTVYNDRIVTSTWGRLASPTPQTVAGLWMSPPLNGGNPGLQTTDAGNWTQLWNATQYEPDPLMAATYDLGGLASYGGQLYWGTMHVPMRATTVFHAAYPAAYNGDLRDAVANTQRAAAIFRGSGFGTPQQHIDLLYGETQQPVFDPTANGGTGAWSTKPTGYTPLYGSSGFGNPYDNYEWIMTVTAGKLFVGMMDWSYVAKDLLPPGEGNIDPSQYGGELWMFDCPGGPARAVDTTGVGNYLNYGVRNMIADGNVLYLGMANPMNLRTDPSAPQGGWELIQMLVH